MSSGKNGLVIYGIGDFSQNHIFLPFAGFIDYEEITNLNSSGYYRTNDDKVFYEIDEYCAITRFINRATGYTVRPVLVVPE